MNSKKMLTSYLIVAILFIIAGIVLLSWPQTTMDIICYGLGLLIFVFGAFQIYTYFKGRNEKFNFRMNILTGLIACGIGSFMLIKSDIVISILPFIVGFTLLLEALIKFKQAYDLKKAAYEGFKWIVGLGALTLLFAILLMFNPFDAATSMVMFIGICLIVDGIGGCWTLYCIHKHMKDVEDVIEVEEITPEIVETDSISTMADEVIKNTKKDQN